MTFPAAQARMDRLTDADFDEVSWHDCHIWGLAFRVGEMTDGDFTSELALDLDFITEWICSASGPARFRVAPAELVFHTVSDLQIAADWRQATRLPNVIVPVSPAPIAGIDRAAGPPEDRARWTWTITLSSPSGGLVRFVSSGFSQVLRSAPVEHHEQRLPWKLRQRLIGRHHEASP